MTLRRRDFITLLSGAAAAWPLGARAQQAGRVRRVGVLTQYREAEPAAVPNLMAFERSLRDLGWIAGSNLFVDYRGAGERVTCKQIITNIRLCLVPLASNADRTLASSPRRLERAGQLTRRRLRRIRYRLDMQADDFDWLLGVGVAIQLLVE